MVIGVFHHGFCDQGRRAHAFERRHGAGLFPWSMHDGRVELDHAVSVRQSAVSDAVVEWIELDDIYSGDYGFEHIGATAHHLKSLLHGSNIPAVLEPVALSRRDDQR